MPRVTGFLRVVKRGGRPDNELPGGERPVDPDYGIDEGTPEYPEIDPPPGIWPPLTPDHPWRPIPGFPERPGHPLPPGGLPPTVGGGPARPERPVDPGYGVDEGAGVGGGPILPPGTIWPPLPPDVHGKYLALVLIGGLPGGPAYRYVVIDADVKPGQGLPKPPGSAGTPTPPIAPTPEPKK